MLICEKLDGLGIRYCIGRIEIAESENIESKQLQYSDLVDIKKSKFFEATTEELTTRTV
jgi:hypothetical protein